MSSSTQLGLARAARLVAYAIALPVLVLAPFGLKEPQRPARILIAVLLALVAALRFAPGARARLARAWTESRLLRGVDTALGNALLALVLAEVALAVAAQFSTHPIFAAPNARGKYHVDYVRRQLAAVSGADIGLHPGRFNDTAWAVPKPAGSFRIVALGDSFAYGIVGYERNFLTLLEPILSRELGRPVEIANLGLPWLQPIDYLYLLQHEGMALEPDAVLVCVFAGNDFRGNAEASWLMFQRYRVYESTRRAGLILADRLQRSGEPEAAPAAFEDPRADGIRVDDGPTFSEPAFRKLLGSYTKLLRVDPGYEDRAKQEERIGLVLGVLDRIVALAAPRPVAIAVLPSELQADPAVQRAVSAELGLPDGALDLDRPFRAVAEHFAGSDVRVVDLLPALAAAHGAEIAYHPRDSHWNAHGNRAAAAAIAEQVGPWLRAKRGTVARSGD